MDNTNKYFLPISVIAAGIFIAGAVMWNGSRSATNPGQGAAPSTYNVNDVKIDGEPFVGQANAPVTVTFWSDFQCPYCKAFEVGGVEGLENISAAFPDIMKNYVETGKVKIVFKDVVFLSPRMGMDSLTAAIYSRSVWKLYPEKYYEWRTAVMTAQDEEKSGFGNAASIDALNAKITGIDAKKVSADVAANTDAYTKAANDNTAEAQKLGVTATPSFIIGTSLIEGAQPFEQFKRVIDPLVK